jgi:hypothetical protein
MVCAHSLITARKNMDECNELQRISDQVVAAMQLSTDPVTADGAIHSRHQPPHGAA